jgi:hypothetical protein
MVTPCATGSSSMMPPEAPRTSTWTDREGSNKANAATATASRSTTNSACPPGGTCADPTAANCATNSSVGALGVTAYPAGSKVAVSTGATNSSKASREPGSAVWPSGICAGRPSTVVALPRDTTPSLGTGAHGERTGSVTLVPARM